MKVVIIGSGNVASVLGRKIKLAGHEIKQVISRETAHAELLANELNCGYATRLELIDAKSDIYILAVSDSQLAFIGDNLILGNKLVVHTAGSIPKKILEKASSRYGVLYPLQSLRKEIKNIPEIPILVDGNSVESQNIILAFSKTFSDNVTIVSDEERLKLHLGAIVVNNFSNYLYALTEGFCKKENIDFGLLLPLMEETVYRLKTNSPMDVQTGPAARKDLITIEKHEALLTAYPNLEKIYRLMTESIMLGLKP